MKPKQLLQNFQTEEPKDETMQKAEKATETLSFGRGRFAKKGNDGKFYAYGGNAPDVELDPAELAKAQEAKEKKPAEPDRIEQLKREHIAESKKAQGREVPFRAAPKMKQGSPREIIAELGKEPESPDLVKKAPEKPADSVKKPEATQEKAPKYSNVDPDVLKRMRREEMKYLDPRSARELAVMSDDDFIDYLKYTYDHTAPGGFDKMAEHQKLFYKPEEAQPQEVPQQPQEAPQHETYDVEAPKSRFLQNDPYYQLVREKKPKAYREHLFYPENGKFVLHDTKGEKVGEFASEDEIKKFVDTSYGEKHRTGMADELYEEYKSGKLPGRKSLEQYITGIFGGDAEKARQYLASKEAPQQPQEPDNLQALREKHKKSIIKPSEVAPFWAYVNPRTKYASRFKTEEEALKYAESVEENDQKFAAQQAEMLIKDFQEGKVDKKGLAQFGKNQYAPEILSYLLSKIK